LLPMKASPVLSIKIAIEGNIVITGNHDFIRKWLRGKPIQKVNPILFSTALGRVSCMEQDITRWQVYFAMHTMGIGDTNQTYTTRRQWQHSILMDTI